MVKKLILDTDGGVDDAQALLLLIAAGRAPDAITTVFGNVGLEAATANILAVLTTAGVDVPVYKGADKPLAQPLIDATHIHGRDGLGGAPRPTVVAEPAGADAVGFLVETLNAAKQAGETVDLLMIGPLTNLALVLERDRDAAHGVGQLTIMGGTVYGRGNTTPAAEFNIFADPEAAAAVFAAGLDTVVIPWEPCVTHFLTGDEVDALFADVPPGQPTEFGRVLAAHARQVIAGHGGGDNLRFVDPLAAAVVVEPEIVTKSVRASVAVALEPGITRGMTVVDPSGRLGNPPVTLVEEARLDRLKALYAASLALSPS